MHISVTELVSHPLKLWTVIIFKQLARLLAFHHRYSDNLERVNVSLTLELAFLTKLLDIFMEKLTPNLLSVNCGKIGSSPIMGCEDLISLVILYMLMVTKMISMQSWVEICSQIQREPLQIQIFFNPQRVDTCL